MNKKLPKGTFRSKNRKVSTSITIKHSLNERVQFLKENLPFKFYMSTPLEKYLEEIVTDLEKKHNMGYYKNNQIKKCKEKDCGGALVLRENGKTKVKFYGCSNYPKCKKIEQIDNDE
jgi:hypothetical protein